MASRGVNKAIIVGNLGNDPEMRYLPSGTAVTIISVATSETWNDKQTGQPQERTEWHRIEAFGRLAEIMAQYLRKGSQVYIEGSIRTDKWQDQSGQDRYSTKIRADVMQMLGSRASGGATDISTPHQPHQEGSQPSPAQPRPTPTGTAPQNSFEVEMPDESFDDDIPF